MNESDKRDWLFILTGVLIFVLLIQSPGCSLFGGAETNAKPNAELETKLKKALKEIDESKKQYENVQGNVTAIEQRLTTMETTIYNLQMQITNIQNIQNNEPFSRYLIIGLCAWLGWGLLKFIKGLILAKLNPGSTVKNLIGLNK